MSDLNFQQKAAAIRSGFWQPQPKNPQSADDTMRYQRNWTDSDRQLYNNLGQGLTPEQQQALYYVMNWNDRGGQGGAYGKWASGQMFPTEQDLSSVLDQIRQYAPQQGAGSPGGLVGLITRIREGARK